MNIPWMSLKSATEKISDKERTEIRSSREGKNAPESDTPKYYRVEQKFMICKQIGTLLCNTHIRGAN